MHLSADGELLSLAVVSRGRSKLERDQSFTPEGLPEGATCLFPSRKGSADGEGRELAPITPRALSYIVSRYASLARVRDVSPHDLRHRFGYRMAERVPLHRLAQIMGHDSLDTTMTYVRGTKADLQAAVEEIAWQ
ncbi:MAG: site-specific integrase [Chloroflexota bacterium]|nr:site-specific integrase [Chloroflexota bacterium]